MFKINFIIIYMDIRVNFVYKERIIPIFCKSDEEIVKVFKQLISKINPETSVNDYEFYYNKEEIGLESTLAKNLKIRDVIIYALFMDANIVKKKLMKSLQFMIIIK